MATDVPEEIDVLQVPEPVDVVDHQGLALAEVEVVGELLLQGLGIRLRLFLAHHLPKFGLPARVPHETGSASHEHDGAVPAALHVHEAHDRFQGTGVKAWRGGVEPDVAGSGLLQQLVYALVIRCLLDEASLSENVQDVAHDSTPRCSDPGTSRGGKPSCTLRRMSQKAPLCPSRRAFTSTSFSL